MSTPPTPGSASQSASRSGSIWEGVTPYHWLIVIVASAGWLFDCMDQRLFILARQPAIKELAAGALTDAQLGAFGKWATGVMMLGWATGGIIFGIMSDKIGRVKTMVATLLVYSLFTGLSGLSHGLADFMTYRFLVGLGVGGMFGAATALVAESVPFGFRSVALGSLQALSASGNILGSLISLGIKPGGTGYLGNYAGWRALFFVGILPALLIVPFLFFLREPEVWRQAKAAGKSGQAKKVGSLSDLFKHPRYRRHAIIGLLLGLSGMIGLWCIGFFSPELITQALKGYPQAQIDLVRGRGTLLQDVGAFLGMLAFTAVASTMNRRIAFLGSFILCLVTTAFVFHSLKTETDAYWMLPLMGFAQLALFAGYSIYFPELFPTRLRGTGVGFCYNTVRYLTAPALYVAGQLGVAFSFRTGAVIMSSVYVVGMVALIWAPETKGQPLPED